MRKVKVADVLRLAANEFLWSGGWLRFGRLPNSIPGNSVYSCAAVWGAGKRLGLSLEDRVKIERGLKAMGCPVESSMAFNDFPNNSDRQGARYSWLMFAAMIAEEQGAVVFVPSNKPKKGNK